MSWFGPKNPEAKDEVKVQANMTDAGILVSNGALDYLITDNTEMGTFVAMYVPRDKQDEFMKGRVMTFSVPRIVAQRWRIVE